MYQRNIDKDLRHSQRANDLQRQIINNLRSGIEYVAVLQEQGWAAQNCIGVDEDNDIWCPYGVDHQDLNLIPNLWRSGFPMLDWGELLHLINEIDFLNIYVDTRNYSTNTSWNSLLNSYANAIVENLEIEYNAEEITTNIINNTVSILTYGELELEIALQNALIIPKKDYEKIYKSCNTSLTHILSPGFLIGDYYGGSPTQKTTARTRITSLITGIFIMRNHMCWQNSIATLLPNNSLIPSH